MRKQLTSRTIKIVDLAIVGGLAFLCGLVVGLPILGWWLWPVTYAPPPPLPSQTPYPTYTPWPTLTVIPTITFTPVPDAVVMGSTVNLLEGPGQNFSVVGAADPANELKVIGQYGNCGWLKVTAPSQATGWLPNDGSSATLQKPCESIPAGSYRPQTGVIKSLPYTGEGMLTAENGLSKDAVIVLANASTPAESLVSAYIRSGETYVLDGIPDGTYIVFFAQGSQWNGKEFTLDKRIRRFADTLTFSTTTLQYTTWNLTLHPVPGGTAEQSEVAPEEFPALE